MKKCNFCKESIEMRNLDVKGKRVRKKKLGICRDCWNDKLAPKERHDIAVRTKKKLKS